LKRKPAIIAFLLGTGLGSLPFLLSLTSYTSMQTAAKFQWQGIVLLPGWPVALLLSRANIHNADLAVATVASCLFYCCCFYFLLKLINHQWRRTGSS
jgi:hypothetical protein